MDLEEAEQSGVGGEIDGETAIGEIVSWECLI